MMTKTELREGMLSRAWKYGQHVAVAMGATDKRAGSFPIAMLNKDLGTEARIDVPVVALRGLDRRSAVILLDEILDELDDICTSGGQEYILANSDQKGRE